MLRQKLKMLFLRRQLRAFCSGLFSDRKAAIVTLSGMASVVSALVALIPGVIVR
ncbi:hypothetical protein OG426_34850 [Streptomyces canus]|uniref:hypothetical protein n=1 Tax=Streptomyces canus TaxID=58343 RepID=UPI00386736C1|nr:hypothetical protein OG426_34850 [Streptomyces canus]